jgi:PAS domain S-box-containing protein
MENLMINDESSRLDALKSLDILDSEPEEFFDTITKIASTIVQVPISLVSLIDKDRQWFKSKQGIDVSETPRNISFCTHAVEQGEKLIVEDALLDERFSQNPLVKDNPHIRFYDSELLALEDLAELATREIRFRERIKATQKSLVITENKFKNIFDNAAIGIAMVEPNGRWREVNDELCNIVGYPREELMQLTFQDITHPEDLETDLSLLHQLVTGKLKRYQLEKRYIKKDGSSIWIELTVTMQKTANGEVDYFCSVIKDIQSAKENEIALNSLRKTLEDKVNQRTKDLNYANQNLVRAFEQKIKSEQLLQKKELELRSILDNANDAYVCMNLDGDVIAWNKQAEVTFGWKEHEAVGKKLERLIIPDEHVAAHQAGMKRFAMVKTSKLMGKRIELEAIRKDGSRIPIELCINMIDSDDSTIITSFLRDISDRKQLESLLKKQAFNDPLTGLPNRRKIDEILPIAIQRAQINQ